MKIGVYEIQHVEFLPSYYITKTYHSIQEIREYNCHKMGKKVPYLSVKYGTINTVVRSIIYVRSTFLDKS